jgi:hypothetical protein
MNPTERDAIRRAAADGSFLRDLAAAFGVSHETIRKVLKVLDNGCLSPS